MAKYDKLFGTKGNDIFRVLVCVDLSSEAGRQKLHGIYRFLGAGYAWALSLIRSQKEFDKMFKDLVRDMVFDGILMAVPQSPETRKLHKELGTPTAFIDYIDRDLLDSYRKCVFIHDDDRDIGRCAAQHLMAQGSVASYGYAAANDRRPWNTNRGEQFAAALARRHVTVSQLSETDTKPVESIVSWLRSLPKPAGILAAYDDRALDVLEAARQAGFSVPDDVSVMGISNDELLCTHASPPLTSIEPDHESQGYAAAELLDRMMNKPADVQTPRRPTVLEFPPERIVVRESTAHLTYAGKLVQRALAYVKAHAAEPIGPTDIASALGVSRRLLDLRFRECGQPSMGEILRTERLDLVCALLRSSEDSAESVTAACGFANAVYAKQLFRERFGMSMRDYRNRRPTAT